MNQLIEACQSMSKCFGIINRNIHDDIDEQRSVNIAEARQWDQIPITVEKRLQEIVKLSFKFGKSSKDEWFRIAWPGQESHLCSSAYWIKRNRNSSTFEVVRGTKTINRFLRQKNRGELYANLAESIEGDLCG